MSHYHHYKKLLREIHVFLQVDKTLGMNTSITLFENDSGKIIYSAENASWEENGKTINTLGRLDLYRSRINSKGLLYDPFHLGGAFTWIGIFHEKTKNEFAELLIPSLEKKLKEYKEKGQFL